MRSANFSSHFMALSGSVAQLVEQRTENPCVAGSIPARATHDLRMIDCPGHPAPTFFI